MNGNKIRKLIKEFHEADEEASYAQHMVFNSKGKDKEEYEFEEAYHEDMLYYIAAKIKKLEPSKYMLEKYDLDYILTYA